MTPHTPIAAVRSVTVAFVLLAGITGLAWPQYPVWTPPSGTLWPGETIPTFPDAKPVKPIIYAPGLTQEGFENRWHPVWELLARQAQAQAETVPLPPERPPEKPTKLPEYRGSEPPQKRIATPDEGLCAKHGLRQVWTSATHWRCRP
jgi:hypothetical protein